MSYSIKAVTKGFTTKEGLTKIFIQVMYQRMKVYAPTIVKVPVDKDGKLLKHKLQKHYDAIVNEQKIEIEKRLLDLLRRNKNISKQQLDEVVKGKVSSTGLITDYIDVLKRELQGKITPGRIRHYSGIASKIEDFEPGARLSDISVKWLQRFESWLRKRPGREGLMDQNTIQSKMTLMKAICNYANAAGMIDKEQYQGYKAPKYETKLPTYLTEDEVNKLYNLLQVIDHPGRKLAGYYFYLCCNTGYRISDAKAFVYDERVKEDKYIILRAKKNGQIVSIPIHAKLRLTLDYIKDKQLTMSEQHVREYVKELCSLCGIKKNVTFHSSRHTWAMLLTAKGFTLEEVATTLGDSTDVAKVYARVINVNLHKKIIDRLG